MAEIKRFKNLKNLSSGFASVPKSSNSSEFIFNFKILNKILPPGTETLLPGQEVCRIYNRISSENIS